MGQAKARGSFEQRQALAVAKAEAAAIERQRLKEERRKAELEAQKALPPAVREQRRGAGSQMRSKLVMLVAIAVTLGAQGGKA